MLVVDRPADFRAELDSEELIPEKGMPFVRDTSLKDGQGVFKLPYTLTHLGDLSV